MRTLFYLFAFITLFYSCTNRQNETPMKTTQPTESYTLSLADFNWIHPPKKSEIIGTDTLIIHTDPQTDYWQRTYYGFQNDNAHTFVREIEGDFSFSVKTDFESKSLFDQCGIVMYQDSENWVKASIEFENEQHSRLGSVVTNLGYSDWATTDISTSTSYMWYRLSRRGADFYIENSLDGENWLQMRVLHMHMPIHKARVGVYACSPVGADMKAIFSGFKLEPSQWKAHGE